MNIRHLSTLTATLCVLAWSARSHAYASAEVMTTAAYQYGRFEASIQFAPGSGVVGSFFLWKDGSEVDGTFWNELDFEALDANCQLKTNAYYGNPAVVHSQTAAVTADPCGGFHTYAYEWTPDYIAWLVDGVEVRRETGDTAAAYRDNTADGMQLRFNIWPGDASFGGTFDPSLLPVYQHIDWVQYSSYDGGNFVVQWREDFTANAIPSDWALGTWDSPKGLSTHSIENAGVVDGVLVLALTADDAQGIPGVDPGTGGQGGTGGSEPMGGMANTGGTPTSTGGMANTGGTPLSTGGIPGMGGATGGTPGGGGIPTSTGGISSSGGIDAGGGTTTTGGSPLTGGAVTGGVAAAGGLMATGGASASSTGGSLSTVTGGTATGLGGTDSPGVDAPEADSGCTCRATGERSNTGAPIIAGAFGLLAFGVARRRRRLA